jgi:geranylgeranyl diphosphate synthase type I
MGAESIDDADVARWRGLIEATGAPGWIEELITERVTIAVNHISDDRIDQWAQSALADMAAACTLRTT